MDRVTQLQDCLDRLSELFYTSVGVLQRDAPLKQISPDIPVSAWTDDQIRQNEENLKKFSKEVAGDIVQTSKVIDFLLDKLPGIKYTEDEQIERLQALELENRAVGEQVEKALEFAESLLADVRASIRLITEEQFEYQRNSNL
ncbi:hypothetical protein BJ742DRAFT_796631 [Cladochytrium replicatum]|nr:hypothetical protein BJ742DRAFT_796631 [Cladochytrium replicatum]